MTSSTVEGATLVKASEAPIAKADRFPPGIPYIVGNEGAERFSYYGMRAILYVYLAGLYVQFVDGAMLAPGQAAAAKARATEVAHLFMAGVYAFPLIGGVLADRLLGKYRVIFWVSLIYCAGHAVLAIAGRMGALGEFQAAEWAMYMGLGLIAVGSGGIKPCVSANVGDQFTKENSHLVTKIFQIFYFIINYGSFFSTLLTPYLYKEYGPEIAFGVPGVLMGVAALVFWAGRDKFVKVPPKPGGKLGLIDTLSTVLLFSPLFALVYGHFVMLGHFEFVANGTKIMGDQLLERVVLAGLGKTALDVHVGALLGQLFLYYLPLIFIMIGCFVAGLILFRVRQNIARDQGFLAVCLYAWQRRKERNAGEGFFAPATKAFGAEIAEGPVAVLRIMLVFSMVSVFWALFDQHASTWVEQAGQMNLVVEVPTYIGHYGVWGFSALAFLGGIWLMLWVSNVSIPRAAIVVVLGAFGLGAAIMGGIDATQNETWKMTLLPSQLSALNPLMVIATIPLLNVAVYAPLKKRGIEITPLQKMTVGMFLAAVAFVGASILQGTIETSAKGSVPVLWQFFPYLLMTVAEVLVSATGLEFAYTQSPRAMKSMIMGFWLLCVTMGNVLVAFLAPLQKIFTLSQFFWMFAFLMAGAAAVFMVLAYFYKGKSYLQES